MQDHQPLPVGCIDELFQHLNTISGGHSAIVHLLSSLNKLNSDNANKRKHNNQTISTNEITSLQDSIFSNITNIDFSPTPIPQRVKNELIFSGRLSSVTQIDLLLSREEYQQLHQEQSRNTANNCQNVFNFAHYLPKMVKLQSLEICIGTLGNQDLKLPRLENPFDSITTPIILPSLESLTISVQFAERYLNLHDTLVSLFRLVSFPNLTTLQLPPELFLLTNRDELKTLFNHISSINSLTCLRTWEPRPPLYKNYAPEKSLLQLASEEFIEQLLSHPSILSKIKRVQLPSRLPLHLRNSILKSSYLTSLDELSLVDGFEDEEDFKNTSEWLFEMDWVKNLTSLTFCNCHISEPSADIIANSPYLSNLQTLKLESSGFGSQTNERAIDIILRSPHLSQLTTLHITSPTDNNITTLTTSPHLTNLNFLSFDNTPSSYLPSIASSKTLTNLKEIPFRFINQISNNDNLTALFQSPNIQNLTTLEGLYPDALEPEAFNAFISSPYVTNLTQLLLSRNLSSEEKKLFFSNQAWSNLTSISLCSCNLTDDDLKSLADSPYLTKLTTINLKNNPDITDHGLLYLSQSPNLRNVISLHLSTNPPPFFTNNTLI